MSEHVPTAAVLNFESSRDAGVYNVAFEWKDVEGAKLPTKRCVYQDDGCTISAEAVMQPSKQIEVTIYTAGPAHKGEFDENTDWKHAAECRMEELISTAKEEHAKRLAEQKEAQETTNAEARVRTAEAILENNVSGDGEEVTITKDDIGTLKL